MKLKQKRKSLDVDATEGTTLNEFGFRVYKLSNVKLCDDTTEEYIKLVNETKDELEYEWGIRPKKIAGQEVPK